MPAPRPPRLFRRVLVANRGEIALRIVRTCRRLGIATTVAHSEADRGAPWLDAADAAVCIGPAPSERSYLDQDSVLQAAEQTGCQAIHPGYGFLAQSRQFAARCEAQGIAFIGPTAAAIGRLGDKAQAKRTMAGAGIATIPGSDGTLASEAEALEGAAALGYPVLLKATAGGGGKGMRRCDSEKDVRRAYAEASAEARGAFANPRLYLEKQIDGARHVEFQVLADSYGHAVHLGERECSVQRHHQKLVEESPSPASGAERRLVLAAEVAAAVAALGYTNAGTVEFLLAPDGEMYFMELNTRLQVEHPVTEMVAGIADPSRDGAVAPVDIVEQQVRIAAGQPLAFRQEDVRFAGHAIELRINAEDPDHGFRPDPGTVAGFDPPPEKDGEVRWDSAIRAGYRIPPYYDSLIGKLVVHAASRPAALAAAKSALAKMRIDGIHTTIALHARILADPGFAAGRYDLGFLPALLAGEGR